MIGEGSRDEIELDPIVLGRGQLATGITVISGNPDADDMAAVTAVLTEVLEELAAEHGRREQAGPSAWEQSQRPMRSPLRPGPGAWRSFSG